MEQANNWQLKDGRQGASDRFLSRLPRVVAEAFLSRLVANESDEHVEVRWFAADELLELTNLADSAYIRLAQLAINLRVSSSSI
jgi:8-oxo-dGTP pyrophosphatase MutT (NUDIX family)